MVGRHILIGRLTAAPLQSPKASIGKHSRGISLRRTTGERAAPISSLGILGLIFLVAAAGGQPLLNIKNGLRLICLLCWTPIVTNKTGHDLKINI
jgi:hypothetical protein